MASQELNGEIVAKHPETLAEQTTDYKDLQTRVNNVQDFDKKVENDHIVSEKSTHIRNASQETPYRRILVATVLVSSIVVHILVNILHQVAHVGLAVLVLVGGLVVVRRLDQVANVQARLDRERAPEDTRHVEEQSLKE